MNISLSRFIKKKCSNERNEHVVKRVFIDNWLRITARDALGSHFQSLWIHSNLYYRIHSRAARATESTSTTVWADKARSPQFCRALQTIMARAVKAIIAYIYTRPPSSKPGNSSLNYDTTPLWPTIPTTYPRQRHPRDNVSPNHPNQLWLWE